MAGLSAQTLDGFIIINLPVHIYLAYPEALSVGLILGRFFSVDKKHSSFFYKFIFGQTSELVLQNDIIVLGFFCVRKLSKGKVTK